MFDQKGQCMVPYVIKFVSDLRQVGSQPYVIKFVSDLRQVGSCFVGEIKAKELENIGSPLPTCRVSLTNFIT
jgi:hypothetical protein